MREFPSCHYVVARPFVPLSKMKTRVKGFNDRKVVKIFHHTIILSILLLFFFHLLFLHLLSWSRKLCVESVLTLCLGPRLLDPCPRTTTRRSQGPVRDGGCVTHWNSSTREGSVREGGHFTTVSIKGGFSHQHSSFTQLDHVTNHEPCSIHQSLTIDTTRGPIVNDGDCRPLRLGS